MSYRRGIPVTRGYVLCVGLRDPSLKSIVNGAVTRGEKTIRSEFPSASIAFCSENCALRASFVLEIVVGVKITARGCC